MMQKKVYKLIADALMRALIFKMIDALTLTSYITLVKVLPITYFTV